MTQSRTRHVCAEGSLRSAGFLARLPTKGVRFSLSDPEHGSRTLDREQRLLPGLCASASAAPRSSKVFRGYEPARPAV